MNTIRYAVALLLFVLALVTIVPVGLLVWLANRLLGDGTLSLDFEDFSRVWEDLIDIVGLD